MRSAEKKNLPSFFSYQDELLWHLRALHCKFQMYEDCRSRWERDYGLHWSRSSARPTFVATCPRDRFLFLQGQNRYSHSRPLAVVAPTALRCQWLRMENKRTSRVFSLTSINCYGVTVPRVKIPAKAVQVSSILTLVSCCKR